MFLANGSLWFNHGLGQAGVGVLTPSVDGGVALVCSLLCTATTTA
jgi:hypothetical protein